MEERQAEDLPLTLNRNFQGLLNLVPGTTRAHRDHSAFFNAQDSLSTEVNGQSRLANNLMIEGVDDNERTGLLQVYIPPIEAIETVDVTTSSYDAELGRAGGSVTNVILKSGTNEFHGAAYEINRISALAALPFFQNTAIAPKTPSVYNYYGANIGGPIVRNKTFFFGDFLRINDHLGQFFQGTVPPQPFRNGNFSGTNVPIYDPNSYAASTTCPPGGTPKTDGTCRAQFSFNGTLNVIDPSRISPIAMAILADVVWSGGYGFWRTAQYFETSIRVPLFHWLRPAYKYLFLMAPIAAVLWLFTYRLPAMQRLVINAGLMILLGPILMWRIGLTEELREELTRRFSRLISRGARQEVPSQAMDR